MFTISKKVEKPPEPEGDLINYDQPHIRQAICGRMTE